MASTSDAYEVLELIGHGAFGQIRKVRRRSDGLILVRKEISYVRMTDKEKNQLVAEFEILARLKHRNIVEYFHRDHMKKEQSIHLYMEYCGNGDLSTIIKRCKAERTMVPEHYVWSIFAQVLQALYRCHNGVNPPEVGDAFSGDESITRRSTGDVVRILHRDLKPENIFLDMDHAVKLGDFGLSKMLAPEQHLASTYVGTPYYMSPELISEDNYTHKSDIWALGCIVYELCKLAPPFNAQNLHSLGNKIKEGRYTPIPSQYSPELGRMIDLCLQRDPAKRPDTAQLLQMPFVKLNRQELEAIELSRSFKRKEELLRTKEEELKLKEEELRRKDAQFSMEQELARKAIQERCDELHNELRREWEVKARAEIERRVALQAGEFQKREAEARSKLQEEAEAIARRMIEQMDLVPRSSTPAILSASVGNDSGYAGNESGYAASIPGSPPRLRPRTMVPESPADITMGSPSVFDASPRKNFFGHLRDQAPPRMPLQDLMSAPSNQLRPHLPQQNGAPQGVFKLPFKIPGRNHLSVPQNGLMDSLALEGASTDLDEEIASPTKKRTGLNRASTFTNGFVNGSPMKGIGRTGDRFSQTGPKILFGVANGGRSLGSNSETMVKTATINSKALSLVQIAQQNPDWADDLPSPFLKRHQRRM